MEDELVNELHRVFQNNLLSWRICRDFGDLLVDMDKIPRCGHFYHLGALSISDEQLRESYIAIIDIVVTLAEKNWYEYEALNNLVKAKLFENRESLDFSYIPEFFDSLYGCATFVPDFVHIDTNDLKILDGCKNERERYDLGVKISKKYLDKQSDVRKFEEQLSGLGRRMEEAKKRIKAG